MNNFVCPCRVKGRPKPLNQENVSSYLCLLKLLSALSFLDIHKTTVVYYRLLGPHFFVVFKY